MSRDLDNVYTYHSPSNASVERYQSLRATAKAFAKLIESHCPESREQSIAHTKLEEVVMWANASIARHTEGKEQ